MTALQRPARDGTHGPGREPERIPFPVVDEIARAEFATNRQRLEMQLGI